MYNHAPTVALQSLKNDKPTAIIKQIRRGSNTPKYDPVEGIKSPMACGNSSNGLHHRNLVVQRRNSSDELEGRRDKSYFQFQSHQTQTQTQTKKTQTKQTHTFRTPIQPTLSAITDRSSVGDHEMVDIRPTPNETTTSPTTTAVNDQNQNKTRIFEMDEHGELVEVTDPNGVEYDDNLYDEECVDVVYEDDDNNDDYIDEVQIYEAGPVEVASHITWM